jgi:hypothetical protein
MVDELDSTSRMRAHWSVRQGHLMSSQNKNLFKKQEAALAKIELSPPPPPPPPSMERHCNASQFTPTRLPRLVSTCQGNVALSPQIHSQGSFSISTYQGSVSTSGQNAPPFHTFANGKHYTTPPSTPCGSSSYSYTESGPPSCTTIDRQHLVRSLRILQTSPLVHRPRRVSNTCPLLLLYIFS